MAFFKGITKTVITLGWVSLFTDMASELLYPVMLLNGLHTRLRRSLAVSVVVTPMYVAAAERIARTFGHLSVNDVLPVPVTVSRS